MKKREREKSVLERKDKRGNLNGEKKDFLKYYKRKDEVEEEFRDEEKKPEKRKRETKSKVRQNE